MQGVAISGNTGDFTPEPVADRLISTADVLNLVQTAPDDIYLIDVRGRNEYDGSAPFGSGAAHLLYIQACMPIYISARYVTTHCTGYVTHVKKMTCVLDEQPCAEYGGHIGGAVSYPWRTVFDGDGNLRPLDTIRSEIIALDPRGYDENRQMIVYCTRGVRASFAVASFTGAGFNVTLHEGTASHSTVPVSRYLVRLVQRVPCCFGLSSQSLSLSTTNRQCCNGVPVWLLPISHPGCYKPVACAEQYVPHADRVTS